MKIALLTFLDVANFGANLQAASTYNYLTNHGHEVVAINYKSCKTVAEQRLSQYKRRLCKQPLPIQNIAHKEFVAEEIFNQSVELHMCSQVADYIKNNGFDGVIIGSDAVAQHWPWFSTLKMGKQRPLWIEPLQRERRFPNPFWGIGFADSVPTAMMSVSSQNSKYQKFSTFTLRHMASQLDKMKYISVRDAWTRKMMLKANSALSIEVTPDPVFALNQNLGEKIPREESVRSKFKLPKKYVLIGLRSQVFSVDELREMNTLFLKQGMECVAFCIDGRYNYQHPFNHQIPLPLNPLDWFGLIKYASAYIGSNMHPIVSALTNGVPCYSIDNWGAVDFWGHKTNDGSSKVYDVLTQYGITEYRTQLNQGQSGVSPREIVQKLASFPTEKVRVISAKRVEIYNQMMQNILASFVASQKGE